MTYLFSSESVSPGHPDKIADQISDAILDSILADDPHAHVACETLVKNGLVFLAGEINTSAWVDTDTIVRDVVRNIGYTKDSYGFDAECISVINAIGKQSADIEQGVTKAAKEQQGAGDQGLMFGFACNDTESYMPAPITFAHKLMHKHKELIATHAIDWLAPDAKAQVAFIYEGHRPVAIKNIVLSTQHLEHVKQEELREVVIDEIIKPTIPSQYITKDTAYYINPTGRFVQGGPVADCGLTGRKIIVDTYGGMARHGGGCFSGKDPSKVDRSAAYMARYIAKNIVAAGFAERVEVQLAYAIGLSEPTSVSVETFGTEKIAKDTIEKLIRSSFSLTPYGIIASLDLLKPIYKQVASLGHFGRQDLDLPWERLDKVKKLQESL